MFEDLRIEIRVNKTHLVQLCYDTLRMAEVIDTALVMHLYFDLLTHLKSQNVIEDFRLWIERR